MLDQLVYNLVGAAGVTGVPADLISLKSDEHVG
jgi:hypothetical protein